MSAIREDYDIGFEVGPDGVRRYHTTCKVLVHGHELEKPLDISQDVRSITTSKSTKGVGSAAITITPNKNYLNLISANDYINVYFDIGDNSGLTRTFFGFIDRIEENYTVDRSGVPDTKYNIICSDFQKVFEKTQIYYNPHLAGRKDLIGDTFGTDNLGGLTLASKGIASHGSPADIIQNLIVLMLGLGTQFSLPDSYNPAPSFKQRQALLNYIESGLSSDSHKAIKDAGGFEKFLAACKAEAEAVALAENASLQERGIGLSPEELIASSQDNFARGVAEQLQGNPNNAANFGPGIVRALPGVGNRVSSLMDILNLFDFVELASIDGYMSSTSIWQGTGPISSLLRSFSNEIVNELMFDLRPMTIRDDHEEYDQVGDEIKGNIAANGVGGVTYVPAVVFREYPWATITEFDGTNIETNIRNDDGSRTKIGKIPFGAVFSNRPNIPGRHNIEFEAISYSSRIRGKAVAVNNRKLDVAVIKEQEIKKSSFGKTDHEHVNLIETTAEGIDSRSFKFFMQDLQPITTPIHIMRNGLRVRSNPTRFVTFDDKISRSVDIEPNKPQEQEEAEIIAASEKPEIPSDIKGLQAPIRGGGTSHAPSEYGYRQPGGIFKFHNGVDLYADIGITVFSIADGVLVASAPKGGFAFYSQTIIIKHKSMGPGGQDLYSQYSHLSEKFVDQLPKIGAKRPTWVSTSIQGNGLLNETFIPAGTPIGLVGNEGGTKDDPEAKFKFSAPHLHFELLLNTDGLVYPAKRGVVTAARIEDIEIRTGGATVFKPIDKKTGQPVLRPEHGAFGETPHIDPQGVDLSSAFKNKTFPLEGNNKRTLDPIAFFKANGIHLFAEASGIPSPILPASEEDIEEPEHEEEDTNVPAKGDPKPTVAALTTQVSKGEGKLDSSLSSPTLFRQLARWSLLQDHWYQHNSEYLSGSIDMRGAPEIRAGYRLDLPDRGLSFYVEAVNHSWQFPDDMSTTLQVTRGQPNDPFPLYVPPVPHDKQGKDSNSRLAKSFIVPDPIAVRRGLSFRSSEYDTEAHRVSDLRLLEGGEDPEAYLPEETIPAETDSNVVSARNDSRNIEEFITDEILPDLEDGIPPQTGVTGTETSTSCKKPS